MLDTLTCDPTVAHLTKQCPLGTRYYEPARSGSINRGDRVWVYVKNSEAATNFAAGDAIIHKATDTEAYDGTIGTVLTAKAGVLGVAQFVVAFGSFAFILEQGTGLMLSDDNGADQADDPLVLGSATDGGVDVMAAGEEHCVIGYGLENAAAAAGSTFLARVCAGW